MVRALADSGLGRALTAHQFYDVEDRSKCSLMNWTSRLSDLTGSPGGDRAYNRKGGSTWPNALLNLGVRARRLSRCDGGVAVGLAF